MIPLSWNKRGALGLAGALVLAALALAPSPAPLHAADPPLAVREADTVRTVLERSVGRRVEVVLVSGEKLTGVVASVNADLLHLEKLTGREFYDALVRTDTISAVVVRMRER